MRIVIAGIFAALALSLLLVDYNFAGGKAKHTIAEVMQKAMKGGLCGKVAKGKASDEEKKELVALFTSLNQNKPPKGDEGSWKEKTGALLKAAQGAAAGDEKAAGMLPKLANCAACHGAHK